MSDDRIRFAAQQVLYDWKMKLDRTTVPGNMHISMEDELVDLIEDAIRKEQNDTTKKASSK